MKNFIISLQLLQQIVNYLQTRPWNEVNPLMAEIQTLVAEDAKNDGIRSDNGGGDPGDTPVS